MASSSSTPPFSNTQPIPPGFGSNFRKFLDLAGNLNPTQPATRRKDPQKTLERRPAPAPAPASTTATQSRIPTKTPERFKNSPNKNHPTSSSRQAITRTSTSTPNHKPAVPFSPPRRPHKPLTSHPIIGPPPTTNPIRKSPSIDSHPHVMKPSSLPHSSPIVSKEARESIIHSMLLASYQIAESRVRGGEKMKAVIRELRRLVEGLGEGRGGGEMLGVIEAMMEWLRVVRGFVEVWRVADEGEKGKDG